MIMRLNLTLSFFSDQLCCIPQSVLARVFHVRCAIRALHRIDSILFSIILAFASVPIGELNTKDECKEISDKGFTFCAVQFKSVFTRT